MACIEQKTDFNFLNWNKVVGSYTLSQLQASGVPSVCDNIVSDQDIPPFGFGNALEFDGVDDYVIFDTAITTSVQLSISIWFKSSDLSTAKYMLGSSSGPTNFGIGWTSSTRIQVHTRSNTRIFTVPSMSVDTWYHLFAVRGVDEKWYIYLNGVLSSTTPVATTGNQLINFDVLGRRNTYYVDVILDEFAVWDGIEGTQQNATDIYNSGTGNAANDIIINPTIYYHFNGSGTDTILLDSSVNSNNGTLTNFPASGMWVTH